MGCKRDVECQTLYVYRIATIIVILQSITPISTIKNLTDASKENKNLETNKILWNRYLNGTKVIKNPDLNVSNKFLTDPLCARNSSCSGTSQNITDYNEDDCTNGKAICHKYIQRMVGFYQNVSVYVMKTFISKSNQSGRV